MNLNLHAGIGMTSQRTRDRLIHRLIEEGIQSQNVLDIMTNTPRHLFVDEALAHSAYEDTALPIGLGQTISQPYIVARMTEVVELVAEKGKVLEIGTGSGYQTAILAQMFKKVCTIERICELQTKARSVLRRLRLSNVRYRHEDGFNGWYEESPFDAIIVTAAPTELPVQLLEQLAEGGIMVIPIGDHEQELLMIQKINGAYERQIIERVMFVPMIQGKTG